MPRTLFSLAFLAQLGAVLGQSQLVVNWTQPIGTLKTEVTLQVRIART